MDDERLPFAHDWSSMQLAAPIDPRVLISSAELGGVQGKFMNSTDFSKPTGGWQPLTATLSGTPQCQSLWTDNELALAYAKQWNFLHGTRNSSSLLCPPLSTWIFVRVGSEWQNLINLDFGGSVYTNLQLSLRENAATFGRFTSSATGTIPVFEFTGSFSGVQPLKLSFLLKGKVWVGVRLIDSLGNFSFMDILCHIVK